jgi:hypothetical protein
MHIPELLHSLLRRPYIEVVEACLPELPVLGFVPQTDCAGARSCVCVWVTRRGPCAASILASRSREFRFGFGQEQVDVFGHNDVSHQHEAVALARLFHNREEAVAASRAAEERASPVARTSDKVQVMRAISAMQSAGHVKPHRTGSTVPALAKNARTGHPRFRNGKTKIDQKAWATRLRGFLRPKTKSARPS